MPEITRRTFVEGKDLVAEEQDFKSRDLALDVRGWTSYCVFLTDRDADKLQVEGAKGSAEGDPAGDRVASAGRGVVAWCAVGARGGDHGAEALVDHSEQLKFINVPVVG